MNQSDDSQGIVIDEGKFASIDFRRRSEIRILQGFGIAKEDIESATEPELFRNVETGSVFIVKDEEVCFVCVKLNGHNAGGGENAVAIGGKYRLCGGWRDFGIEGSVVVGVSLSRVVYPIPGKIFGPRERRALRHA